MKVSAGTPENYWLDGSDILTEGEWRWMSEEGESRLITGYTYVILNIFKGVSVLY